MDENEGRSSADKGLRLSLPTSSFYKNPLYSKSSPSLGQLQNAVPSKLNISTTFTSILKTFKKKKSSNESEEAEEDTVGVPISFDSLKPIPAAVRDWEDLTLFEMSNTTRKSSLEELVLTPLEKHSRQRAISMPVREEIPKQWPNASSSSKAPPSVLTMGRGKRPDTRVDGAPIRKSSLSNDDLSAEDLRKLSTLQRSVTPTPLNGIGNSIDRIIPERKESLLKNLKSTEPLNLRQSRNLSLKPVENETFFEDDFGVEFLKPEEPDKLEIFRSPAIEISQGIKTSQSQDINPYHDPNQKDIVSPSSLPLEKYKTLSISPVRGSPPKFMTLIPDIRGARSKAGEQDLVDMKKWVFEKELEAIDAISPELTLRRKSIKRNTTYKESHVALTPTMNELPEESEINLDKSATEPDVIDSTDNESTPKSFAAIPNADIIKDIDFLELESSEILLPQPPAAQVNDKLEIFKPSIEDSFMTKATINSLKFSAPNLLPSVEKQNQGVEAPKSQLTESLLRDSPKKKSWKWIKNLFGAQKKPDSWDPYPKDHILPNRLSEAKETEIYSLSHVKLAQTDRPLLEQVQISNLMMYILSVHSDVTLKGRGPQRKRRRKKRRIPRNPLIPPEPKVAPPPKIKKDNDAEALTSSSDEDEEKQVEGTTKIVPLISVIPPLKSENDEDEIPLGMLAKNSRK